LDVAGRSEIREAQQPVGDESFPGQNGERKLLMGDSADTVTSSGESSVAGISEWLIAAAGLGTFELIELTAGLIKVTVDQVAPRRIVPARY
jgi:hypothetical protein